MDFYLKKKTEKVCECPLISNISRGMYMSFLINKNSDLL